MNARQLRAILEMAPDDALVLLSGDEIVPPSLTVQWQDEFGQHSVSVSS